LLAIEDAVSGIRSAVGAGLRCLAVALHEAPETLIAAGAAHVVPDFENVFSADLECLLLGSNPDPRPAAALGVS
jgi:beta-phosphoglucomutase-like phosphatase (HAD superfamily)